MEIYFPQRGTAHLVGVVRTRRTSPDAKLRESRAGIYNRQGLKVIVEARQTVSETPGEHYAISRPSDCTVPSARASMPRKQY